MFDKENCKREVFRKYQEELNKKITFRKRTKRILMTAVSCVSIILVTTTIIYTRNKLYEKDINEKTHTLNPGKIYDGDQTANIVENKVEDNNSSVNNKEENVINEVENNNSQINYETTSEFFKLLKIVELKPTYQGVNEENNKEFRTDEVLYEELDWDAEASFIESYYKVGKQDDNLVITILGTNEMKVLLSNYIKENMGIEYDKNYIISNVNAENVDKIFYASYGQSISDELIVYLIQKDGTVKGIDVLNGCKTGIFVANDISGLENVDRLENMNAWTLGCSVTVIAYTKDNKIYELDDYDYLIYNIRKYEN